MKEPLLKIKENGSPREEQLTMGRKKPQSLTVSAAYRLNRLGSAVFGKRAMMRLSLNLSRLFSRFAFELISETYGEDFHNRSLALSDEILEKYVPRGSSVIDVGCGFGRACRLAAKYADVVVGVDYDKGLIQKAIGLTTDKNVEFMHGDATRDIGGKTFDVALLIHVIEHIDDADTILRDLSSISKRLIVEVPDFQNDPLNPIRLEQGLPFYSDGDHVREYTESMLIDQLTRNGWDILEVRKNGGAVLAVAEHS